jgi:cytochrome P450
MTSHTQPRPAGGAQCAGGPAPGGRVASGLAGGTLSLDGLAASPASPGRYAPLRGQPVHQRAGEWVGARPDDVKAVLASGALTVALAGEPDGAARRLQARMARFTDGPFHAPRRTLAEALLPAPADAQRVAWSMTSATMAGWRGRCDAMDLAWRVPVAVLGSALGVPSADIDTVVSLSGQLCDALAPRTRAWPGRGRRSPAADGDAAATALATVLAKSAGAGECAVAAASILFQARDATAGLIGLAVSAAAGQPQATAADLVELVLRSDPPVQSTRRTAAAQATIGGVAIPAGGQLRVLLATADSGEPGRPATFGRGPHACPGRLVATALARGVVGAVLGGGWRPVPGQSASYQPRPNLRIPVSVPIERS